MSRMAGVLSDGIPGVTGAAQHAASVAWPPSRAVLMAGVIFIALTIYALLGGADFGGGVWDLLASGPRRARQRDAIAHAIGPIWEANHVWLILVVVLLFTCFPVVFADLGIVLDIPLTVMLMGIVLRGSAFAFRAFEWTTNRLQQRSGHVFAVASVVTPFVLGMIIGAIASGGVGRAPRSDDSFVSMFVAPWVSPFTLAVGLFALALFAFLAAVYLTVDTAGEPDLQSDFRTRALAAAAAVFVTAAITLATARVSARVIADALTATAAALLLHVATAVAAVSAIVALVARRFSLARVAAAAQVVLILAGWAFAQYPYIVPPTLTIDQTAAPPATLTAVFGALAAGALVLFPALGYLFRVFKASAATRPR
jgi:cytochrome bd ubiquinol oxidase subunit II